MRHVLCLLGLPAAVAVSTSVLAQQFAPAEPRGYVVASGYASQSPAVLADVDGDGDADAVLYGGIVANTGGRVLFQPEAGRLPPPASSVFYGTVAVGDVDGDGDPDVVRGGLGSQTELWLNDGGGRFGDATPTHVPLGATATQCLELGDVDGDGDLDLLLGNGAIGLDPAEAQNRLWLNDGTGRFTDVTATHLPSVLDVTAGAAFGDVDADGDLDLVLAEGVQRFPLPLIAPAPNRLLVNDGQGRFTDRTGPSLAARVAKTFAVELADLDGDGDLDLVARNETPLANLFENDPPDVFFNDGAGRFTLAPGAAGARAVEEWPLLDIGDIDGDGDPDIVSGRVRRNDGTGVFTLDAAQTGRLAGVLADLDGDGDLDLFGDESVFANDGAGRFEDRRAGRWPSAHEFGLARVGLTNQLAVRIDLPFDLGAVIRSVRLLPLDADGDGDVDAYDSYQGLLYTNDGSDVLVSRAAGPPAQSSAAAAGDLDGDGDVDVVVGGYPQPRVLENDGAGGFADVTAIRLPAPPPADGVALCDLDGDGDLDLLVAAHWASTGQDRVFVNDGSGRFTDATATALPVPVDFTNAVELGDVDGDGDPDLLAASTVHPPGTVPPLLLNDGRGVLTPAPLARLDVPGQLADIDGDGDLDVVGIFGVAINDGAGVFTRVTGRLDERSFSGATVVGDIDRDGDVDLVGYRNRHRQLEARGLPRIGHGYELEIFSRPGYATTPAFAVPLVAFGAARLETALGLFALDPATASALPPLVIPAPTGSAVLVIRVPHDRSLVDMRVWWQAVVAPIGEDARLTNSIADQLIGG